MTTVSVSAASGRDFHHPLHWWGFPDYTGGLDTGESGKSTVAEVVPFKEFYKWWQQAWLQRLIFLYFC